MNYEEELKAIAEAQKQTKLQELETAKQQALGTIQSEQDKTIPEFQKQRQQASTQSQLGAKNFAEYLARRGQTNAGIGRQAEASRMNTLGNTISGTNTQEGQAVQNFANQRTQVEGGFQSNLLNANNEIDTNLSTNLYNEKIRQDEIARKTKQQEFENQMTIKNYNLNVAKASEQTLPEGMTFAQNGTAYQVLNGKTVPINYAVKSTSTNSMGTKTTQYVNQKQYDWNRQGYWLQPQAPKINFGTSKVTAMTPWFNQNDNKQYIISYGIPLPITGNEKDGREVISNAYKSGVITKEQLKKLTKNYGY